MLDRRGRPHRFFAVAVHSTNAPSEQARLGAYHEAGAKARRVADALNAHGARKERTLRKAAG